MLRVCGVTYDHTINYGSCLQAYALQKAIESFTIGEEYCHYELIPVRKFPDYLTAVIRTNSVLKKVGMLLMHKIIIPIERRSFKDFENRHMRFSNCRKCSELKKLNQENDAFICGSDVIWNTDFNYRKSYFYLDFAKKYTFSYAASFGKSNVSEAELNRIKPWIEKLDCISVRDDSSAMHISKITNHAVIRVADPVLLLTRKEWDSIADECTISGGGGYIFVYLTDYFPEAMDFICKLRFQTGLKVVAATADHIAAIKMKHFKAQSPQLWLNRLKNAEYVITNSFHASVFSVIFQKKFFTVVKGSKDVGINIRMHEFLENLGLQNRLYNAVPEVINLQDIDFIEANAELERMREFSLKFLHDNLMTAYEEKLNNGRQRS